MATADTERCHCYSLFVRQGVRRGIGVMEYAIEHGRSEDGVAGEGLEVALQERLLPRARSCALRG